MKTFRLLSIVSLLAFQLANAGNLITPADILDLEYAADPRISPNGDKVAYVRKFTDKMTDKTRGSLWLVNSDGSGNIPMTDGDGNDYSPRWSPDGKRLVYASIPSSVKGPSQIYLKWIETNRTTRLSSLNCPPQQLTWSPDGEWIAFTMFVPEGKKPFAPIPGKPGGAAWATAPLVVEDLLYRCDRKGYLKKGYTQLFILPAEGGTARQVTKGPYHVEGAPDWLPDGKAIVFTSKRRESWQHEYKNTDIYRVELDSGTITQLTDRIGPDDHPIVSPDGNLIAYTGYDDKYQIWQTKKLYLMDANGNNHRMLSGVDGPHIQSPVWAADGKAIYYKSDSQGISSVSKIAIADGKTEKQVDHVSGAYLPRPYPLGTYTVANNGRVAYTAGRTTRPSDVAVNGNILTDLNHDTLDTKQLVDVEERWVPSSHDNKPVQYWLMKPPGFNPDKKYPMILEIHGGPFTNYGPRFSADFQIYAAAGYIVAYANPRGSSSYGEEFGNAIHHSFPGHDYDDLMSVVDDLVTKQNYIDTDNLFVTGGSGGGTLTAWVVGKTNRFKAAVAAKPIINWSSFVLTSDIYNYFHRYWFPGAPWECPEHYHQRSPISLVGNVTTPTMLLTGEQDYRTPISEAEQFYQALQIRKIDTALVRFPGANHLLARPSQKVAQLTHTMKWFDRYRSKDTSHSKSFAQK